MVKLEDIPFDWHPDYQVEEPIALFVNGVPGKYLRSFWYPEYLYILLPDGRVHAAIDVDQIKSIKVLQLQ